MNLTWTPKLHQHHVNDTQNNSTLSSNATEPLSFIVDVLRSHIDHFNRSSSPVYERLERLFARRARNNDADDARDAHDDSDDESYEAYDRPELLRQVASERIRERVAEKRHESEELRARRQELRRLEQEIEAHKQQ